jgi:hypothetical protein
MIIKDKNTNLNSEEDLPAQQPVLSDGYFMEEQFDPR